MTLRAPRLRVQVFATTIASAILGLALIECIVRVWFPAYDPSGQVAFTARSNGLILGPANESVRQRKNTGDYDVAVRFNRYGFRDEKDVSTARAGDIVVVGDSFAFGWGVEESQRFSNVLQTLLHRRVFNVGIPSGDFEFYDRLLKHAEHLGGRFDDVVIAVCMENDLGFYNAARQFSGEVQNGAQNDTQPRRAHFVETLYWTKLWLSNNSALYRMFTTAVQQNPLLKNFAVRAHLLVPNLAGMGKNTYSPEIVERSADRLAEITSRYSHAAILIIPSRALWAGDNRAVEDRVHRAFVAALSARHLNVSDVRKTFEAGGDPLSNHFSNDGHWNKKGHHLAAKMLVTQEAYAGQ